MNDTLMLSRRNLLRFGAAGTAFGAASLAMMGTGWAEEPASPQVALIYELQAAFHRAKTMQDIDLMMSLWASNASLNLRGNPHSPFVGSAQLRAFWLGSGSFTHRRLSLVPSFKTRIDVHGNAAYLYFECHDIGDYDLATRYFAGDSFLAGTVRRVVDGWVFADMTAGSSAPLSADHYYYP